MKRPKEVLSDWVAAYNARDPYALAALYHDDAESHQVALGEPVRGRPALLESFIASSRLPRQLHPHAEPFLRRRVGHHRMAQGGTFTGPLGDISPTGRAFTLHGCFFRITDGRIAFQRGYFDRHTWFSQLGIPIQ